MALVVKGNPLPQLPPKYPFSGEGGFTLPISDILDTMGTELERTDLDKELLRNAKKSLTELAELTGLTEAQAAVRLSELYQDRGALYDLYRERALMEEIWDMKNKISDRLDDSDERNTAGLANAWRSLSQLMIDRWDKERERNKNDIERIDNFHAEVMGRALGVVLLQMVEKLGLDPEETSIVMEEVLPNSFAVIQSNGE